MRLVFQQKIQETPTVYSFLFKPDAPFQFLAGQFIRLTIPHSNPDQRGISRTFTIASSPTESFVMITTRMMEGGSSFKKALLALSSGTVVEAGEQRGLFVLPENNHFHCLFITGGVGATPVRSILKYATDKKLPTKITLLYSNVTPEEVVYYDFLSELITNNSNLDIVYTVTQPEKSSQPWSGRVGRIDKQLVREKIKNKTGTKFYISGPISLVENLSNVIVKLGIPPEQIIRENFPGY